MVTGFYPGNDARANSAALQLAADAGGEIRIDVPGIYDVADTISLGDDTSLIFGAGVYIRRQKYNGEIGLCIQNKGAHTGIINKNIKVVGLNLIANDVESTFCTQNTKNAITGFRAHLGFMYVKDLVIRDFVVCDINSKDYAIQITDFENVLIENVRIEGMKDGIHFGPGNGFTIRHGIFRTFDDPIALNGSDYSVSNPHLGWIENGLIEDCYDLDADSTTGFFTRILSGAWVEWYSGMELQHSDAVVYNHRLYRVVMSPDGTKFRSYNPPDFKTGIKFIDGIRWDAMQDEIYTGGCRNITFRDIHLCKKREVAFCFQMSNDNYLRSYYPNAEIPYEHNFVFDNISVQNEVEFVIYGNGHPDNIKIVNSDLKDSLIGFEKIEAEGMKYPHMNLTLSNCSIAPSKRRFIDSTVGIKLKMNGTDIPEGYIPEVSDSVEVAAADIELKRVK